MKIGIISDTHDQRQRTLDAIQKLKYEGATILFHCGDLVRPDMASACEALPCYYVFGNNDSGYLNEIRSAFADLPEATCLGWGAEVVLDGKRLAITHGHLHREVHKLLRAEPDYLFSGHTHIADDRYEGKTRRINPGALHRACIFSVALLDLDTDQLTSIEVPR